MAGHEAGIALAVAAWRCLGSQHEFSFWDADLMLEARGELLKMLGLA